MGIPYFEIKKDKCIFIFYLSLNCLDFDQLILWKYVTTLYNIKSGYYYDTTFQNASSGDIDLVL